MWNKLTRVESISAILLLLLSISIWFISSEFPKLNGGYPGPSLFPQIIAGIIAVLSFILLFGKSEEMGTGEKSDESTRPWLFLVGMLVAASLFPIISQYIGFIPSVFIFSFSTGLLMRLKWKSLIFLALGTTAGIYLIFGLLLNIAL